MRDFDKKFNKTWKLAIFFYILYALAILVVFIFGGMLIYYILTNPEVIGEFFGRIASGYQSVTQ
jgi:hypothetical protein